MSLTSASPCRRGEKRYDSLLYAFGFREVAFLALGASSLSYDYRERCLGGYKKRLLFTALALVLFAPCYLMWQIVFDISLFSHTDKSSKLSVLSGGLPWVGWLFAFAALTAAAAFLLVKNIRYDKTYITNRTIKLYLDRVPCGICCWRENGRVLFSNICMNRLCEVLTGEQLLNGRQFSDAVGDGIVNADGRVRRFLSREILLNNERLYEIIASDITDEYAKTEALKKDKEELSRLNRELSDYYLGIDESVRRREILQAKIKIHDEMNRLMLSTVAADKNDTETLDEIFSLWEQNALLLSVSSDKKRGQHNISSVKSLAKSLGLRLIWREESLSELNGSQKELFFFTAREAVVNAVKHADAEEMRISFEKTRDKLIFRFSNDGKMPLGEVNFEGGLSNIARLAQKQGATLHTEVGERFELVLGFEINGE